MEFFLVKQLTVFVLLFFINFSEGPPMCCKTYHWNQSNQTVCTECSLGYYGSDCSYACRFPSYGKGCQSECLCEKENCNHITGCDQRICLKGYSGPSCNSSCQFPSYGADCRLNCSCEEQYCDFIIGCSTSVPNETYWTTDLPLNKTKINTMYVSYELKTSKKDQPQLIQRMTSDSSAGVPLNCSTMRPDTLTSSELRKMVTSLCVLVVAFLLIMWIYHKLNTRQQETVIS